MHYLFCTDNSDDLVFRISVYKSHSASDALDATKVYLIVFFYSLVTYVFWSCENKGSQTNFHTAAYLQT